MAIRYEVTISDSRWATDSRYMRLVPALVFRALVVTTALQLGSAASPTTPAPTTRPALRPAAASTSTTPALDATATIELHEAADAVRRDAGRDPLFRRSAYITNANRIASAVMNGQTPTPPGDDAPVAYTGGIATDLTYGFGVASAISDVIEASRAVLEYPLHTDGGWSVMTKRTADGRIAYGVALVVGWPSPNVSRAGGGCSSSGYCWSNGGLNPHLPWTRNTVKWYLSTSNLPAAGESLVKSAIAKVNAIPRMGAHVVYGGKTTVTAPTSTRRFVIVFGSGCSSHNALGCTITSTQGTNRMVFQAKTIVTLSRYRANPSTTWWTGTLMHEIAHGMGLGHYDATYNGSYQLMRSANGPDYIRSGDANGLRYVAPGGAISAYVTPAATSTGAYRLVVRTANSGLGGIRAIRTQCTDSSGAWRTVGLASGTWDTRAANRTVGSYDPPAGATRYCRAVVRSKTAVYTTAKVAVRG
jgi:hypothetical protein